jgi:thymidine kinase
MNNENSFLHLILGPMFAGKSTKLLNILNDLKKNNSKFLLIKHILDTRYNSNNNNIITHDKQNENCIGLNKLLNIIHNEEYINSKYILIDEGQFFSDINLFIEIAVEKDNKHVIITSLNGDYKRKPFQNISKLISIANQVDILNSNCNFCNEKGIFTLRISNNNKKILIGDNNIYKPVCRKHYIQYNK